MRNLVLVSVVALLPACAGFRAAVCGTPASPGPPPVAETHGIRDGLTEVVAGLGSLLGPLGSLGGAAFGFAVDLLCRYGVEEPSLLLDSAARWTGLIEEAPRHGHSL